MPVSVSPMERSRYREAADVLARAFRDDPVVVAIMKDLTPDVRIKTLAISFYADLLTCGPTLWPLEAATEDGIAVAAVIHRPGEYPLPASTQLNLLWQVFVKGLVISRSPTAFGRWLKWLTTIEKKHPREPHYYLEFIGTDIPVQGKGLGSRVLQCLVDRADGEGLGCYLETGNPRTVPLYHRFGFQTKDEQEVIGVHTWFLWRPPGGKLSVDTP